MHFDALTKPAAALLRQAKRLAAMEGQGAVGTEYVLLAMLRDERGVAGELLRSFPIEMDLLLRAMGELLLPPLGKKEEEEPDWKPEAKQVFEKAASIRRQLGMDKTGTEHLLLAMLEEPDCTAAQILMHMHVQQQRLYSAALFAMGKTPEFVRERFQSQESGPEASFVASFSTDMTASAARGELDPLIGREAEVSRLLQILSRRTKNNPCLIGEPGVGKTAIVEGLALRIAAGEVPPYLREKRLLKLDVAGMVAGTKYRGEFEERMKGVLRELEGRSDILLFVDELHTLIGAGGAEGSLDAANMMKPALSRGSLQIIGATTVSEYRKHVEKDAALERRFQSVLVEEPTIAETVEILQGLKPRYEAHHGVEITDAGINAAAEMAARYITDRFLPDKAIDLMDEAASRLRLIGAAPTLQKGAFEKEKEALSHSLENALTKGALLEAAQLRQALLQLEASDHKEKRKAGRKAKVGEQEVAEVVSAWMHIPLQRLTQSEAARLKGLESALHKHVIAQEEAVNAVARAVRRGRVGLKDPSRPIGSFLFLGPTGVGKTEISKVLAREVFGTADAMIRVDMSEYMEKHSVSKMIGSPPGYVGYDEGGQLCEQVRRHPYAVVLFDEIEKAHPDVFHMLLQILDDGHITDAQGRKVNFKNTILIMTSNAGAKSIIEPKRLGFAATEDEKYEYERMKANVMEEVRRIFKPEFLNRIDSTVVFHALSKAHMKDIVTLMTTELCTRCSKQLGISLTVRDSVKKWIVEKAYDPKYGARPLRREIQTSLEDALTEELLRGRIKKGDEVVVSIKQGELLWQKAKA